MEGDEENIEPSLPAHTGRPRSKGTNEKSSLKAKAKNPPKPKHRIVVHQQAVSLEQDTYTQQGLDVPSSQPWRLRGPIWHRPKVAPTPSAEKDDHSDDTEPSSPPSQANGARHLQASNDINDNTTEIIDPAQDETRDGSDDMFDESGPMDGPSAARIEGQEPPSSPPVDRDKSLGGPDQAITHQFESENAFHVENDLADLPSDAFASSSGSSPEKPRVAPKNVVLISSQTSPAQRRVLAAPQHGLRQTTLFGRPAENVTESSQANKRLNFSVTQRDEPPTHHELDQEAIKTWIYPTNLGAIRDYQYNIVARGLFHNLLVALPTGLGKTFIAATVMLNWFRWTKSAQILFVAPAKPLVFQQIEACFNIVGIPRSETVMLTGDVSPNLRPELWKTKRVFFLTPHIVVNDLKSGWVDPKRIALLVVDEAHRATGNYSYVEVVQFIRRFNRSFRVLALTATPGNSVDTVQEVINKLDIARIEIRTEFSLDIRQYVHTKTTSRELFSNSEEMVMVMDFFSKAVQPVLNRLSQFNAYWSKDPMALTPYGLTQARSKWMGSDAGRNANFAIKGMVNRIFTVLASLAHGIELLKYHGIGPFYHTMLSFRSAQAVNQGGKYEREILDSESFTKMMTRLQFWMNNDTFIGHPKLEYLQGKVLEHFTNAAESSATRIMIFAHYRDSAEEIVRVLNRNAPLIRPHVFVGQASSKGSEGMDQKKQQAIIREFKEGKYNTLVATSIGEEGLDIGEIDLIICYDSSASPIRMLQRMGRTGRKRAGNIVLLLMRGKEENSFIAAKDNYEKMQTMISEGKRFDFNEENSPRILPKGVQPVVDKRHIEIPVDTEPIDVIEPTKKGRGRGPKRPPKRFNMPDNVRTGFVRASRIDGEDEDSELEGPSRGRKRAKRKAGSPSHSPRPLLEPIPSVADVTLSPEHQLKFEHNYLRIAEGAEDVEVRVPSLTKHLEHQRKLGPTRLVGHSRATTAFVGTLSAMRNVTLSATAKWRGIVKTQDLDAICGPDRAIEHALVRNNERNEKPAAKTKPAAKPRGKPAANTASKASNTTAPSKPKAPPKPRGRPPKPNSGVQTRRTTTSNAAASHGRVHAGAVAGARARPPPPPPSSSSPSQQNGDSAGSAIEGSASPTPPPSDPHYALPTQGIDLGSDDTSGGEEDDDASGAGDQMDHDSELDGFVVEGSEDDGGIEGEEVEGLTSELGREGPDDNDSESDERGSEGPAPSRRERGRRSATLFRRQGMRESGSGDGTSASDSEELERLSQLMLNTNGRGQHAKTPAVQRAEVGKKRKRGRVVLDSSSSDGDGDE